MFVTYNNVGRKEIVVRMDIMIKFIIMYFGMHFKNVMYKVDLKIT